MGVSVPKAAANRHTPKRPPQNPLQKAAPEIGDAQEEGKKSRTPEGVSYRCVGHRLKPVLQNRVATQAEEGNESRASHPLAGRMAA
jgi:hypothetical protein